MVFNVAPRLPRLPIFEGKFIKPFNSLFRSPHRPDRINASQVSLLDLQRLINVFRIGFDAATLTAGSMDSVLTFWKVSRWLHNVAMSQVSHFVLLRLIHAGALNLELYRYDLDSIATTPWSIDPMETFGAGLGWLRESGMSAVSDFVFSRLIDADALDIWSSVFAPRLPWHPEFEGGFANPSYSFSRSPYRLDHVNAS